MHLVSPPSMDCTLMLTDQRMMLCYVVMSFLALCGNIYQNPIDPKSSLDLKLMKIVTNFLSLLKNDEAGVAAHQLLYITNEFERLARRAVKIAQDKQNIDLDRNRPSLASHASNNHATPNSMSGTGQTNGFLVDIEGSISGGNPSGSEIPQQSAAYSDFGASGSITQNQSSPNFDAENADISQLLGSGPEEVDFTNGNILPEYVAGGSSSEFWQLPMPLEWNWSDMNTNYFPTN